MPRAGRSAGRNRSRCSPSPTVARIHILFVPVPVPDVPTVRQDHEAIRVTVNNLKNSEIESSGTGTGTIPHRLRDRRRVHIANLPHCGKYLSSASQKASARRNRIPDPPRFADLQSCEYLGSSAQDSPSSQPLDTVAALRYTKVDAAERHSAPGSARGAGETP
jgi:hypothetical protein